MTTKKQPPPKPEPRKTFKNDGKCENCGRYYHEHLAFKWCPPK